MKNILNCEQILALLPFYCEGSLDKKLKKNVEEHLKSCESCFKVYEKQNTDLSFLNYEYFMPEFVMDRLSAYIDNEMDDEEAVKIRKMAISNPNARKKLEDLYKLRRELHNSVLRTKNDCKTDFSRIIINKISGETNYNPFFKIVWTFAAMMCFILAGFLIMLYS